MGLQGEVGAQGPDEGKCTQDALGTGFTYQGRALRCGQPCGRRLRFFM